MPSHLNNATRAHHFFFCSFSIFMCTIWGNCQRMQERKMKRRRILKRETRKIASGCFHSWTMKIYVRGLWWKRNTKREKRQHNTKVFDNDDDDVFVEIFCVYVTLRRCSFRCLLYHRERSTHTISAMNLFTWLSFELWKLGKFGIFKLIQMYTNEFFMKREVVNFSLRNVEDFKGKL